VNQWHFENDGSFETDMAGLSDRVQAFYQGIQGNFGAVFATTGHTIKIYDYADDKPRVPKLEETFTFNPGGDPLPGEVAVCLSMEAEKVSGVEQARRRGRVYLGPLTTSVASFTANDADVRVADAVATDILTHAETMATGGTGAFRLAVFSPTTVAQGGTDDAAWNDVTHLWIDDAFDIIRKRGARPTKRSNATVS
jgi:hypothetical protein